MGKRSAAPGLREPNDSFDPERVAESAAGLDNPFRVGLFAGGGSGGGAALATGYFRAGLQPAGDTGVYACSDGSVASDGGWPGV